MSSKGGADGLLGLPPSSFDLRNSMLDTTIFFPEFMASICLSFSSQLGEPSGAEIPVRGSSWATFSARPSSEREASASSSSKPVRDPSHEPEGMTTRDRSLCRVSLPLD